MREAVKSWLPGGRTVIQMFTILSFLTSEMLKDTCTILMYFYPPQWEIVICYYQTQDFLKNSSLFLRRPEIYTSTKEFMRQETDLWIKNCFLCWKKFFKGHAPGPTLLLQGSGIKDRDCLDSYHNVKEENKMSKAGRIKSESCCSWQRIQEQRTRKFGRVV